MPKFVVQSQVTLNVVDLVEADSIESARELVLAEKSKEPIESTVNEHIIRHAYEVDTFADELSVTFGTTDPRYLAELEKEFVLTSGSN